MEPPAWSLGATPRKKDGNPTWCDAGGTIRCDVGGNRGESDSPTSYQVCFLPTGWKLVSTWRRAEFDEDFKCTQGTVDLKYKGSMLLKQDFEGKRGELKSKAIPVNDNPSETKVYNFFNSPEPVHQSTPQATPADIDSHENFDLDLSFNFCVAPSFSCRRYRRPALSHSFPPPLKLLIPAPKVWMASDEPLGGEQMEVEVNPLPAGSIPDGRIGSSLVREKLVEEDEHPKEGEVFEVDVGSNFETQQLFPSKESLVDWVRIIGLSLGFVVTVKGSDKLTARMKPRVFLGCDRGGKYRDNQNRKNLVKKHCRKSSSKRCGCPFTVKGQKEANVDEWKVVVVCGKHNHEMVHLEAHAYAGRLSVAEEKLVEQMYGSGVKPRKILAAVKKNNELNKTTIRTIYNERVKIHKKELDGATPVQFLYRCITKEGYVCFNRVDARTNQMRSLFFAHPVSIQLSNLFPTVFQLDCTYKTNRWALDCFKSVLEPGVTPVVMVTDREIALMNSIEVVFPKAKNLLCQLSLQTTNANDEESPIDISTELEAIAQRFAESNEYKKKGIKRKLQEFVDPSSTQMIEPQGRLTRIKGRPKGSLKKFRDEWKSTKRDLSHFEHVLKEEVNKDFKMPRMTGKLIARKNTKVHLRNYSKNDHLLHQFREQLPSYLSENVLDVRDVLGDGHCGFRVVSHALDMGDDWLQVRKTLYLEFQNYIPLYDAVFGNSGRKQLMESLECTVTPAPLENWMSFPDLGLVIASCYNVGFVNGNHFILLAMRENCPLPLLFTPWTRFHEPICRRMEIFVLVETYRSRPRHSTFEYPDFSLVDILLLFMHSLCSVSPYFYPIAMDAYFANFSVLDAGCVSGEDPPRITTNVKQNLQFLRSWRDFQKRKVSSPRPATSYRKKKAVKDEIPEDIDLDQDPTTSLYHTNQCLDTTVPVLLVDGYNMCGYWTKLKKYFTKGRLDIARQKLTDELIVFSVLKGADRVVPGSRGSGLVRGGRAKTDVEGGTGKAGAGGVGGGTVADGASNCPIAPIDQACIEARHVVLK
ncbi:hypothetical protein KSP39_PZI007199 [Platanthera zijinensis]|uniref:FAR1 domain-containing protein n=1 Tax=Platanthera zijinensis TaxID=2320716 RepID=A0AAP0G9P6_9ASPA